MPRYEVQQDTIEIPCEHPKCEQLHERYFNCQDSRGNWFHMLYRKEWIVVHTDSGMSEFISRSKAECFRVAKRLNEGGQ